MTNKTECEWPKCDCTNGRAECGRKIAAPQPPAEAQAQGGGEDRHDVEDVLGQVALLAERINYSAGHDEAVTLSAELRQLVKQALSIRSGLPLLRTTPPSAPVGVEAMFILNREYLTRGGDKVKLVSIHNPGTDHETMACAAGVHRYTRRLHPLNFGRVTGTDGTDQRDLILPTLAQQPAAEFSNDGNSEADFIAHHADACTACGGSGHKADQQPAAVDIEGLRRALCVIGVVGTIDGYDVIRRESMLDIIDRRRSALAAQPGGSDNDR